MQTGPDFGRFWLQAGHGRWDNDYAAKSWKGTTRLPRAKSGLSSVAAYLSSLCLSHEK